MWIVEEQGAYLVGIYFLKSQAWHIDGTKLLKEQRVNERVFGLQSEEKHVMSG